MHGRVRSRLCGASRECRSSGGLREILYEIPMPDSQFCQSTPDDGIFFAVRLPQVAND